MIIYLSIGSRVDRGRDSSKKTSEEAIIIVEGRHYNGLHWEAIIVRLEGDIFEICTD